MFESIFAKSMLLAAIFQLAPRSRDRKTWETARLCSVLLGPNSSCEATYWPFGSTASEGEPTYLPEDQSGQTTEQQMFYNWYEGNLSRFELMRLYGLTMDIVEQTLQRVARTYDEGRHYGMVKWLIEMGEDGDIIWLLSKDMTAADVGLKVRRNQWVVYKHRDAVLKRFQALGLTGDEGRAFCVKLFGLETGPVDGKYLPQAKRDRALKVSLPALGIEAQAPAG